MKLYILFVSLLCAYAGVEARKRSGAQDDFQFVEDGKDRGMTESRPEGHRTWMLDPENALCGLLLCGKRELCLLQDRFTAVCVNKAEVTRNGDKIVPLEQASLHDWNNPRRINEDDEDDLYDEDDEDYDADDDEEDMDDDALPREQQQKSSTGGPDSSPVEDLDNLGKQRLNRKPFALKTCQTCPVVRPVFICGSDNRTYSSLCRLHYHNCIHEAAVHIACKGFCPCQESSWSRFGKKDRQRDRKSGRKSASQTGGEERRSRGGKTERSGKDASEDKHASGSHGKYGKSKNGYKAKYNNKHGNYAKYGNSKFNNNDVYSEKRGWDARSTDVNHKTSNSVWGPNECSQDALAAMGNRMLDWFSVIMSDARAHAAVNTKAPNWCKPEVAWMLNHLDNDGDSQLSVKELYQLEHDDRERCIKPFIDRCDLDRDVFLSAREWCKCFDKSERPCAALRRVSKGLLGGYIPECDSEGYYRPTQCHDTASMCWCVDKHGVEVPNSRTRGSPNCDAVLKSRQLGHNHLDDDAEDEEDLQEHEVEIEGSADMPLDI